jgi:lysophospholipase L1-like esterase
LILRGKAENVLDPLWRGEKLWQPAWSVVFCNYSGVAQESCSTLSSPSSLCCSDIFMKQGKLLFIGDSLLVDFNWQQRITHFEVINLSVAGETAQGLLARLPVVQKQVENPHIIVVMTGTNNLYLKDYNYLETLREIVVQLSQYYPTAEVILNSLLPIQLPGFSVNEVMLINKKIEALSLQSGCCYLDMFSKLKGKPGLFFFRAGSIHITEAGYNLWAKSILEFIAFLLEDDE